MDFSVHMSMFPWPVYIILSTGQQIASGENNSFMDELQPTQEQVNQIKMIEHQYSAQIHQLTQEMRQAEMEINGLMVGAESSDRIQQKERELEALKMQVVPVYFEKFLAIREILTLSQLQGIQNIYLPPQFYEENL